MDLLPIYNALKISEVFDNRQMTVTFQWEMHHWISDNHILRSMFNIDKINLMKDKTRYIATFVLYCTYLQEEQRF